VYIVKGDEVVSVSRCPKQQVDEDEDDQEGEDNSLLPDIKEVE